MATKMKLTPEAKARNAEIKAEADRLAAERAARASLDACEGATISERDLEIQHEASRLGWELERQREAYVAATADFAKKAARMAEDAAAGTHPFYTGSWFAREAAELEARLASYKAAIAAQQAFQRFFPDARPII